MSGKRLTAGELEICKRYSATTLWKPIVMALSDHLCIIGCGITPFALIELGEHAIGALSFMIMLPLLIRSMRGLECLAHDASHRNWFRRNRVVNDLLGNLLAAVPVMSTVAAYRSTHFEHHRQFNTEYDIDLRRHREHNFASLREATGFRLLLGLGNRYVAYWPGWWTAIRTNWGTVILFLIWHVVFLVLPLAALFGFRHAAAWWITFWLAPFLFALPILRMIGEAGEHDYTSTGSPYELTYTNTGWVYLLIYPHNDGYHTLHHMSPSIPFFSLGRAHTALAQQFPEQWTRTPLQRRGLDWPMTRPTFST